MDHIEDSIIDYLDSSGYTDSEVVEFYQELISWCEQHLEALKGEKDIANYYKLAQGCEAAIKLHKCSVEELADYLKQYTTIKGD